MKNIHVLPTDKPSRLFLNKLNNKILLEDIVNPSLKNVLPSGSYHHIYITSDEEIKYGDLCLCSENLIHKVIEIKSNIGIIRFQDGDSEVLKACKKIILTTDQDLINDGVQAIDDEFLEWFVKNPSCEWVEIEIVEYGFDEVPICNYKIIIPKEEPKQETLEEVFDISMLKEYLLDFVDWQNRCSKWVTIPESMVDDYLDWKKFKNK